MNTRRKSTRKKVKKPLPSRPKRKYTKRLPKTPKKKRTYLLRSSTASKRANITVLLKRNSEEFESVSDPKSETKFNGRPARAAEMKLFMNRLIDYPRNVDHGHLITLRELACLKKESPESILSTTFGYEMEYIKFLLKRSKVFFVWDMICL